MFNESFLEVLKHEGVVSVTSWANENMLIPGTVIYTSRQIIEY